MYRMTTTKAVNAWRCNKEVGRREAVGKARGVVEGLLRVEQEKREKAEKELAELKMKMEQALWEERYPKEIGRRERLGKRRVWLSGYWK